MSDAISSTSQGSFYPIQKVWGSSADNVRQDDSSVVREKIKAKEVARSRISFSASGYAQFNLKKYNPVQQGERVDFSV